MKANGMCCSHSSANSLRKRSGLRRGSHGREIEAGGEVGRHHILTHCYWHEAGPEFKNVNIMAVAHGTDKRLLLDHKAAIDRHLRACSIPVSYTNVFWGGRSEIKPSEISPRIYHQWLSMQEKS